MVPGHRRIHGGPYDDVDLLPPGDATIDRAASFRIQHHIGHDRHGLQRLRLQPMGLTGAHCHVLSHVRRWLYGRHHWRHQDLPLPGTAHNNANPNCTDAATTRRGQRAV